MLHAHPSHYNVTKRANALYVFFSGQLNHVKRIAFAHGLEQTAHEHKGDMQRERIHFNHGTACIERESLAFGAWTLRMSQATYRNN